jgi:hypothetical protein
MRKLVVIIAALTLLVPLRLPAQDEVEKSGKEESQEKLLEKIETYKKWVSQTRGKEFISKFKVTVKDKEDLRKSLVEKAGEPESLRQLEQARKVCVKLGLIDKNLDVKKLMLEMLTEQIAGFYDPENDELCVMEKTMTGIMADVAGAHEIFHALQDQYYHLDAMLKSTRTNEDMGLVVGAIVEGEANLGGFEYVAAKMGQSIVNGPIDFGKMFRQSVDKDLKDRPDSPMAKAPSILRDPLLFRYIEGSSFVQRYLKKHKSWKKLDQLFDNPPLSSEQIMHPEKYLDEEKADYPVQIILPELHEKLEGKWKEVATNTMGEFQTKLLLAEYIDKEKAAAAAAGWDGDRYTMIESEEEGGPQIIAWLSVWDTMQDAQEFVKGYAELLTKRFKKELTLVETGYFLETGEGTDTVLVEFSGTQALVIQGAPASLVPAVRAEVLKARQVEMKEKDFGDLAKQKLELPKAPEKASEEPEKQPEEKPEKKPGEKEPSSKDF